MLVSIEGGTLSCRVQGRGEPLLLLRPLGGSQLSWDRFAEALADTVQVVTFDPRGVGASSPAPLPCSTRQMASDARALLRALQLPRVNVYGISLGGMVATWLSIEAPTVVNKLVLASTLPRGLDAHAPRDALAFLRSALKTPPEAEAALVKRILSPQFRARHPDKVQRIQELARAAPASHRTLLSLSLAALRHDARKHLHRIAADTLVLIGEYDPLLTLESQRKLLKGIPSARYTLVQGAGHDISLEAPERTAALVLDHVA